MGVLIPALRLQARREARGVRQRGGGAGRGEEDGGVRHLVGETQRQDRHRQLRAALRPDPPRPFSPH